uniref:LRRCT domain-containing protein n=1 Tax=Arion vulgaris TaxID=1028688 RepID=A0A0B7BGG7_9EUPU
MKMVTLSGNRAIVIQLLQILLLFHLCMKYTQAHACPHSCTCQGVYNTQVNCSSKFLLKPPTTSASTLTLDLSHNSLGPILNASFAQMRNLTLIDLSQNALTLLLDCTFSGMLSLKTVNLHRNRLTSLPEGLFTDANKIEHLDLSYNLFVELPNNAFKNLPHLKTLDVSHNMIVQLTLGLRFQVPRHIQAIDISYNYIEAIRNDSFEIASAWERGIDRVLNLAFCRISSIESGAITQIPNLNDLDLSGNSGITMNMLENLTKELETGARNLDRLSLAHMNLTTLVPLFTKVSEISLKFLNVSFNSITDVPADVFSTIRSLRVLDLSRNQVHNLAVGFSDLVSLRVLNVSHNLMQSFDGATVTHLSNLHTLDVSHNKLTDSNNVNFSSLTKLNYLKVNNNFLASVKLPTNISNLQFLDYHSNRIREFSGLDDVPILEIVDLSDNDLETVTGFLFRGARFVKMANFSKNSIKTIDHRAFLPYSPLSIDLSNNFLKEILYCNWVATQKLYLNHNSIAHIDNQAFHGMTGLEELDLSKNQLVVLHEDLFYYLNNLKHLNLSYNGLLKLLWLHLFRNLDQLETLDLGYNSIINLNESMLFPLSKIQRLYIQANRLQTIIPRVFRDVAHLKVLDLSNNPFDCICDMLAFKDWLKRTKISVIGLYVFNSTAYHCRTPEKRAGLHVLNWNEDEFECNRSMLYLIIVCSIGVFFIILAVIITAVYKCYKNYKWKAEIKKKLKEEEENRKKRKKRVDVVKLSNQEIAEAIKEAVERKSRKNKQKSRVIDRQNKYIPLPGLANKHTGKRSSENDEERKAITGNDKKVQKERRRSREGHYEKLKMEELATEELEKQKGESPYRHPEKNSNKRENHIETRNDRHVHDNGNFDPYHYDRRLIQKFQHPQGGDLTREDALRDQDRMAYYKRDPRYWHTVGPERRNSPYIISPANIFPNRWDSDDEWNRIQGGAYQGHRRSRQEDHRMDGYTTTHIRDTVVPRHERENRVRERISDHNRESFPFYNERADEGEPIHYTRQHNDDPYHHPNHQRSHSYNYLPQDYNGRAPHLKKDRLQKRYESINQISNGIGPRAVSQPYLARESTSDWL